MTSKKPAPLTVERRGNNEDGSPHYAYTGEHVLYTGPFIEGYVTLADGTVVDVSPKVIAVDSPEQAAEIDHHIGIRHEEEGHPRHAPTPEDPHPEPFLHLCTDRCGTLKRPDSHPMQAMALARAQRHTDGVADGGTRDHHAQAFGTSAAASMALAGVAAENAALNGLDGTGSTNVIPDVSLHTASPSTTGANENANTGSYARQAGSWNAAASGSKTNSAGLTFSTAGSVAVTHFGTWSSATYGAGNYAIGGALNASVTSTSITIASGALALAAA